MTINYKTEGAYLPYEQAGNALTFNGELTLVLDRYERDEPVHLDVCLDNNGNLVTGVIPRIAELYAAQIDIPARAYTESEGEPDTDTGEVSVTQTPNSFNIDNVTLTLWALTAE